MLNRNLLVYMLALISEVFQGVIDHSGIFS